MIEEATAPPKKKKKKGSSRSIETLYRSAYRTQLDLTSIADAKANIMISVNGLIITGIIATTGLFSSFGGYFKYLPLLILLISISSMVFAVLAAKPKFTQSSANRDEVNSGAANLLYFANFNVVSEQEYTDSISSLIEDTEDVYNTMSRHIYNLGLVLTNKYRFLKYAYSIFLYGMITISILFTLLFFNQSALSARSLDTIDTTPFASIYEPSGLVYVGEGEFLVVEDEPNRPFHRLKLDSRGSLREMGEIKALGVPVLLNDLEGITFDGQYIYATTSHSQNKSGNAGNGRMALVRYEYLDGALQNPSVVLDVKDAIVARLQPIMSNMSTLDVWEKINIEALAWSPTTQSLNIAFRAPLVEGKSLVMRIENPDTIFSEKTAQNIQLQLSWLEVENNGIRAMSWDANLNGFFIVTSRRNAFSSGHELWKWSGDNQSAPIKITDAENPLPQNTEGISTFSTPENSGMIVVVDDGNEELDLPGHYKLISLEVKSDELLEQPES